MSDYFEGLKLAKRIGVPCATCQTASIWCAACAAKWRKACEGTATGNGAETTPAKTPPHR